MGDNTFFKREGESDEAPFNMAWLHYTRLNVLMTKKTEHMVNGDVYVAYECLEEMFTMISFKLNKEEEKDLSDKFSKLQNLLKYYETNKQASNIILSKIKNSMRELDRQILKFMHKYKMIFPKIEVHGGLKKLKEKYDI